jgi:probable rRNA maturation factor
MTGAAKLSLTVQYATDLGPPPSRSRLRMWAAAAIERSAAVTLRFVDEVEGHRLNRDFRGKDYATNVLTFNYGVLNFTYGDVDAPGGEAARLSGDIVLCTPVVSAEAQVQGKPLEAHFAHLVVHGMLHLQGYDHERDDEAQAMETRETEILVKLGYADPHAAAA